MSLDLSYSMLGLLLGVGGALAGGVLLYLRARFQRELVREQRRRAEMLRTSATLRPLADIWSRARGCGQIPILAVGSYGARLLPSILKAFMRAGAADHIGMILLLELDHAVRQICLDNMPPIFRDRIMEVDCPLLPAGMLGGRIDEALAARALWESDVVEATTQWLGRMQRETRPALLLCLLSPGGMASLGRPVLDRFHERYPRMPIYMVSILDQKTVVRQRFPAIRAYYAQGDLIRGTILMDNLRDSTRADVGIAALLGGMVSAAWVGQHPLELWNGLAHLFPTERPGGFATISVWAESLPVSYLPTWRNRLPEVFYTPMDLVKEKIIRGVQQLLERPDLQSVPLEPGGAGCPRLCYIITPIIPDPDLKAIATWVEQGLQGWRAERDPDFLLHFASTAVPLSPLTQEIPLVLVLVQPLEDTGSAIDGLALGAYPVAPGFAPLSLTSVRSTSVATIPVGETLREVTP